MSAIEVKRISPEEMISEIETSVKLQRENKYAFQVGLKDLDFDVNHELLAVAGLPFPFQSLRHFIRLYEIAERQTITLRPVRLR
jgi:hypothetical protein